MDSINRNLMISSFGAALIMLLSFCLSPIEAKAGGGNRAQQHRQDTSAGTPSHQRPLHELANLSHDCGYLLGLWNAYTNSWSAFSSYDLDKFTKHELIGLYYGARSATSPMRWTKGWRTEDHYTYTQVVSAAQIADYLMNQKYQKGMSADWWRNHLKHWASQLMRARNIIEAAAQNVCQPINNEKIYDIFSIDN